MSPLRRSRGPLGRRSLSRDLRRAARPGSSRRVDGTAPLGRTLAADSYNILLLTSRIQVWRLGPWYHGTYGIDTLI